MATKKAKPSSKGGAKKPKPSRKGGAKKPSRGTSASKKASPKKTRTRKTPDKAPHKRKAAPAKKKVSGKKGSSAATGRAASSSASLASGAGGRRPELGKWLVGLGLVGAAAVAVVVAAQAIDRPGDEREVETVRPVGPHPEGATGLGPMTIPEALRVEVIQRHPHDPEAFTQGLLWHDGQLFESTGLELHSSVRRVDLTTGEVAQRHHVTDEEVFAEGLALANDSLVQLTWQSHKAFVYDAESFALEREFEYEGEGWGLCFDGADLVMSDGSDTLSFRDPETFEVRRTVDVTKIGRPLRHINELECVDGHVYANVWQTDEIVRIDPGSGRVTAVIDARGLLTRAERGRTDVLNGIAWAPERETFLITGKLWPWMFEVRFVPR